jgi:hypothetical protein
MEEYEMTMEEKFKLLEEQRKKMLEEEERARLENTGLPDDFIREERIYFDANGNVVDKENAIKGVIQMFDKDGKMIGEKWIEKVPEQNENGIRYDEIYTDEAGNEVPKEEAVYVIFRKYDNDKIVSEEKILVEEIFEKLTM